MHARLTRLAVPALALLTVGAVGAAPATAAPGPPVASGFPVASGLPVAHAATAPRAGSDNGDDLFLIRHCFVAPRRGVRAVMVRTGPFTRTTALGQLNRGQRVRAACGATRGGRYAFRGCQRSTFWVRVRFHGRPGYVAWGCVHWFLRR